MLGLLSAKDHMSHPVFTRRTGLKGTHLVHTVATQLNRGINSDIKNFRGIPGKYIRDSSSRLRKLYLSCSGCSSMMNPCIAQFYKAQIGFGYLFMSKGIAGNFRNDRRRRVSTRKYVLTHEDFRGIQTGLTEM